MDDKELLQEEEQFAKTLDKGLRLLEQDIAELEGTEIPGETVFTLYDTYGFPVDLTNDIARERGLTLDYEGYEKAMEAQREVSDVTNELLRRNAEALHQGSVEVAKEAERGIVELETLKHTNSELIKTLEEVRQIQSDGRARRAEAEAELGRIEGELKQKLLEIKG